MTDWQHDFFRPRHTQHPGGTMTHHPTTDPVIQAMASHPTGRHGHRYAGPHGDDHRVGHARPERDTAPGDLGPAAWIALDILLILIVISGIPLITVTTWRIAVTVGAPGAVGPAILIAGVIAWGAVRARGRR